MILRPSIAMANLVSEDNIPSPSPFGYGGIVPHHNQTGVLISGGPRASEDGHKGKQVGSIAFLSHVGLIGSPEDHN
jgi:hypothetical protein